ncbi:uncharacterized protein Tco025E_04989 [Trypanosoma conorhini]|uniref:Transmembrane protein n=1 Tax=Trypanosoma conorhini TaxID=83891 RepID=A0A3R7ML70_9TRYP|nr:uncharacterized protein Tco025E_04989 [Trypanosoma conorhini]RNF16978.1 hypothetical protein Tco025E_04989 [Trypanosoma conorhini]
MSRVRAWATPLPNGNLEVAVWNSAGEGAAAVIFSLRSSHPRWFAPVGPLLPDGVLLPGERQALLLDVLPECARRSRGLSASASASLGQSPSAASHERLSDVHLIETPRAGAANVARVSEDDSPRLRERLRKGCLGVCHGAPDGVLSSQDSSLTASVRRYSGELSEVDGSPHLPFVVSVQGAAHDVSPCPYFFVYYGQLGDGDAYVHAALKWLKREQQKCLWGRQKALRQLRESGEPEDYLPPVLGRPVRWLKNMDGGVAPNGGFHASQRPYSKSSARMFAGRRCSNGCVIVPCRPLHRGDAAVKETKDSSEGESTRLSLITDGGDGAAGEARRQCGPERLTGSPHSDGNGASPVVLFASPGAATASRPSSSGNRKDDKVPKLAPLALPASDKPLAPEQPPGPEKTLSPDLPRFVKFEHPANCHARTETEATVEMLDHTVCGDSRPMLEEPWQGKKKDEVPPPSSAGPTATNVQAVSPPTASAEWRVGDFLEEQLGNIWNRRFEKNASIDAVRVSPTSPLMPERVGGRRRTRPLEARKQSGEQVVQPQIPALAPLAKPSGLVRVAAPSSREKTIVQLGDALCTIAVRSAPLLQTAMGGTVSTVATTAQLFWGMIEDSVDILRAVCIPALSIFSLFLLCLVFVPTEDEDGTASVMELFA